ncbi:MAG: PepSY domain-containing protein [Planctomycetota bacterium]
MSTEAKPKVDNQASGSDSGEFDNSADAEGRSETNSGSTESSMPSRRRKKKLGSRVNMWIRRIHLFSGLFMLPWVLLYGFTALLFNHPTYMADSKTQIENFSLPESDAQKMPIANELANVAVVSAVERLNAENSSQTIELAESPNAIFTRQVSGSVENDERNVSVVLNLNTGKGYLRNRSKDSNSEGEESEASSEPRKLEDGIELALSQDPVAAFKGSVTELLKPYDLDADDLSLRSMPNVEFDAIVNGKKVRLRLSQRRERQRRGGASEASKRNKESDTEKAKPVYQSNLSIVGQSPREMSTRSFLLRLHMAHGYGVQTNSRWFWAIAVDLMFASMCFWGLSGVVMWWQIKRTRRLGFMLLVASAIVAAWLAIGMHWQLVNG